MFAESPFQSKNTETAMAVYFDTATIVDQEGHFFWVESRSEKIKALKAFDCLTRPAINDLVLLTITSNGCFISQILTREDPSAAELEFTGNLTLRAAGSISIESQENIQLKAHSELEINSERLSINNLSTRFRTLRMLFQATEAETRVGRLTALAEWVEQRAESIRQRFTRSDRVVSETDQQQAGNLIQRVDKTASLRAEHAIIKARKDVQVDGKRIHMG